MIDLVKYKIPDQFGQLYDIFYQRIENKNTSYES